MKTQQADGERFRVRRAEFSAYARHVVARRDLPQTRFIVFGEVRTGSNLLTELLNLHPSVLCTGEMFLPFVRGRAQRVLFPHFFIRSLSAETDAPVYGLNLKHSQLMTILTPPIHGTPRDFLRKLYETGWRILHLSRTNVLRQAISSLLARDRQVWRRSLDDETFDAQKLLVQSQRLFAQLRWREKAQELERNALETLPRLALNYETHLLRDEAHQPTMDAVFDYLGVERIRVSAPIRKLSSDDLAESVANYKDLEAILCGTKYEAMLYEP